MREKRRWNALRGWPPALLLGLLAAVPAAAGVANLIDDLRAELKAALRAGGDGSRYSVLAVSLDTGDTLFAMGATTPLAPASNMKLLTTAAALQHLGAAYRYPTYLLAQGPVENGVLRGDLILYGTGDPGISDRFQDSRTAVFEAFADTLAARGIRSVAGDVVGDGTFFRGPLLGEGWDPRDLDDWFAAPSSGLSYNENTVTLRVVPTSPGQPPEVRTLPDHAGVPIVVTARTVSGRASPRIHIERASPREPIVVEGEIRESGREVWRQMTVGDPAHYAASVFEGVLEERGIEVRGLARSLEARAASPVGSQRLWAPALREGPRPRVVATHRSPPLREYLPVVNKESHNLFADLTLKTLGRVVGEAGSFRGGAAVVQSFLASRAGVDTSHVIMLDGSGLSDLNRVAAADFVSVLSYMASSDLWDAYWASLPEAGNPRGLRRMYQSAAAGNLRAKTGTIEDVSALSGLVRSANGERIAFSILANDVPSTWGAKRVEDRIGARLASFERPFETLPAAEPTRLAAASSANGTVPGGGAARPTPEGAAERTSFGAADSPGEPTADADEPATRSHTVRSGENLTVIARRYGVRVNAIVEANDGLSPRRLMPGQRLVIPSREEGEPAPEDRTDPDHHVVEAGENLTVIARHYNVSLNQLLGANPDVDPNRLQVGQRIAIPDAGQGGT